jgi:1,4-dihydroxy-2-naphthoate octaprenyltransferase
VPDREADARAGKRTLPVRLGVRATGLLYAALHLSAWVGVLAWARLAGLALWPVALFAMLLLPALFAALGIARGGASLPLAIRTTLAIHAAGSLGLASWAALAR